MSKLDTSLVSLADLSAAGVHLRPIEAATLVRALLLQVSRGDLPGVPSAHVIRLGGSGGIFVEGPVAAGGAGIPRAAQLLEALLPDADAAAGRKMPGALRLVVARALGSLDLPAYPSIDRFAEALARFAAPDEARLVRELVASWATAVAAQAAAPAPSAAVTEPLGAPEKADVRRLDARSEATRTALTVAAGVAPLTVSDIRRARRATGLTLDAIADRSRIPAWLLRELEWGYLRNWPAGHYGRTQLTRYARAAGLDDLLVLRTVWPLIEEAGRTHGSAIVPAVMTAGVVVDGVIDDEPVVRDEPLGDVPPAATIAVPLETRRRSSVVLAALAIPALLALGLVPAFWYRAAEPVEPTGTAAERIDPAAPASMEQRRETIAEPAVPPGLAAPVEAVPVAAGVERSTPDAPARLLPETAVYSPSFASAGTAMFYHADGGSESALMRADTDSRGAVLRVTSVLDDHAQNFHARPSPDGGRIAFDSDRDGERAVYIADSNGSNVRRVSGPGFAAIPSWSPGGDRLAYVRAEAGRPRVWNLWLTDLDSGEERRLTTFKVGQPWGASWFPDGDRIAYSHETRLVVRDLASGREQIYPSPIKGRLVRTPAVSPDGRRVIFQVYRDGTWLLDLPDGSMRRVLTDPSAEEFTWSPDGRRVAYHSARDGAWGVWVMASR